MRSDEELILTAEEYERGFIDFDAILPHDCEVELWTRTTDQPTDDAEWTGPYITPTGAKVLSPPKPYMLSCLVWVVLKVQMAMCLVHRKTL
ncbi:hypothetical protein ACFLYR_09455 [Chloroflexota bacterium]